MISWTKIYRIAYYELNDALRSRRFILVLALYMLGAGGACFGFITALHRVEVELANALGLTVSESPGAVAEALWKSVTFQRMVRQLVGDAQVAQELLTIPPVALIYGWLAFTFTPILVMLSAPGRIAEDVASGYARFSLVRATRTEWCIGKYLGQALEIIIPLMLSAITAWAVARFRLFSMAGADVVLAMFIYGWKVWVYCLAFTGLALGVSQVCRSPNQATAIALLVWAVLAMARGIGTWVSATGWKHLFNGIAWLAPSAQRLDLWRTSPAYVLPAIVYVVALGAVYFTLGHIFFLRRDL
jgi:ABC-type transport system involved in multi-copper enzyme maturation permease subunit